MPSDGGGLLGPLFGGSRADAELSDRAWLQAMLDAERALAVASARAEIVPEAAATAIAATCRAGRFDPDDLGRRAQAAGNPVVALVRDLTEAVEGEAGPEAARWVHHGATSQDILDTASSLIAVRALGPVLDDLDGAAARLATVRRERLAAQLGGAAGTLASLGPDGGEVARGYAEELGLAGPALPWHTNRVRVAELAGALGRVAAHDLVQRLSGVAVDTGRPLHAVLLADAAVREHLDETEMDRLLGPEGHLGSAEQFVDRALTAHRARRAGGDDP